MRAAKLLDYIVDRSNLPVLVEVRKAILGELRPASTLVVAVLAREELLVEIEAIVALPGPQKRVARRSTTAGKRRLQAVVRR